MTDPSDDRSVVTVVAAPTGHAEVHKRASTPAARERLRRQATVLRHGRHPGVIDLVELRTDEDGSTVLITRLAGSHTLATWSPPTLDELAGLLVALAETLADLHHLGLSHGAVEADHVVLDPAGRPVLCGFTGDRDQRAADDVAALGRLTRRLVEASGPATEDAPLRRGSRRQAAARRRLLQLADQTIAADPATRPGARRFAAAVVTAVPTAALTPPGWHDPPHPAAVPDPAHREPDPDRTVDPTVGADAVRPVHTSAPAAHLHHPPRRDVPRDPDPHADLDLDLDVHVGTGRLRPRRGRRTRREPGPALADHPRRPALAPPRRGARSAVAILGLALMVVGALSAWNGERPELTTSVAAPAPPVRAADPSGTDTAAPGTNPEGGGRSRPATCTTDAPGTCSAVRPGGTITRGEARFALGEPTDELVVADPRCPTPPAVALLRPADGATYLFDRWATPGQDVAPRAGPVVEPGSHWAPVPLDADGCALLAVRGPTGEVELFDPAPPVADPAPPAAPPPDDPTGALP